MLDVQRKGGGMKIRFKAIVVAVSLAAALFGASPSASAYQTWGDHVLIGGVGNYGANDRLYVLFAGAQPYGTTIHNAMHDWIYTTDRLGITTPISWLETTSESAGTLEIHASGWLPESTKIIAATEGWTGTKSNGTRVFEYGMPEPTVNWNWCKIRINTNVYDVDSDMAMNGNTASYNRKGSIAHEIGHVMGLAHTNGTPGALMCQLSDGRTANDARANECNGINYLY
jgi:hypothetical protein